MEVPEHFYKELTKLQAWLTGWRDAGKMPPPGSEVIVQLRRFLKELENET